MPSHATIGIDNGSSGSIGIIGPNGVIFETVPTKDCLHYGKRGTISKRLDRAALIKLIEPHNDSIQAPRVFIERPFTGKFINSVLPAHRFFEAMIIVMEDMGLGYEVVDSGEWQASVLGNVRGSAKLKRASKLRGIQLYPQFADAIKSHTDADGLLIAHHYYAKGA